MWSVNRFARSLGPSRMHQVVYPLLITIAVQCMTAFGIAAVPVLIPALAAEVGVASGFAGIATATIYGGAIVTSYLGAARVAHRGSIRSSRTSLVIVGLGLALCAAGRVETLVLGALAVGLGFGPVTSASTSLLTRFTPASSYGLVFAVNRISVPAGAALAAVILPMLSQRIGWQGSLLVSAGAAVCLATLLRGARSLDLAEAPCGDASSGRRSWLAPLRTLLGDPRQRLLAMAALAYLAAQSCLGSFTIAFLVDAMRMPYVQAGVVLAAAQIAGVSARLLLGIASDRVRYRMALSGFVGMLITIGTGMAAFADPGWSLTKLTAIFLVYGTGALGWNGIVLAELAHSSPAGRAGEIVGTFTAVSFSGAIFGPMLFSALLATFGYGASFGMLAAAAFLASVGLIGFEWRSRRSALDLHAPLVVPYTVKAKDPL